MRMNKSEKGQSEGGFTVDNMCGEIEQIKKTRLFVYFRVRHSVLVDEFASKEYIFAVRHLSFFNGKR